MALVKLSIVLAVLVGVFSGKEFVPYARLIMTSKWLDGTSNNKILDSLGGTLFIETDGGSSLLTTTSLGSTRMNNDFRVDFSSLVIGTDIALSFWYYEVDHDISGSVYPFIFARDTSYISHDYSLRSDFGNYNAFFTDTDVTPTQNSDNDMAVLCDTGKWVFLTFYWSGEPGSIAWSIFSQSYQNTQIGTNPVYVMPTYMQLGVGWDAYVYEIIFHKGSSSAGSSDPYVVTLLDNLGGSYIAIATTICPAGCAGLCHPEMGCLTKEDACQCPLVCDSCNPTTCDCEICSKLYRTLTSNCQCFENCESCISNTECDYCSANYFLNTDSDSNLRCFSCLTSCDDCVSGECFECATLVVQNGASCREDSVGYQISFEYPNIVIDFASPLGSIPTKDSFSAKYQDSSSISIANWIIDPTSTVSKVIVVTDNVKESDLPISVDFSFNE